MDNNCNNIRGNRHGREGIAHCPHVTFHSWRRLSSSIKKIYRMNKKNTCFFLKFCPSIVPYVVIISITSIIT